MKNTLLSVMTLVIASLATVHKSVLLILESTDRLFIAPLIHRVKKQRKNVRTALPPRTPRSFYVLALRLKTKLKTLLNHIKDNVGEIEVSVTKPTTSTTATQAQDCKIDTNQIPDQVIKSLARLFLPDILEFYSAKESTPEPEQQKRETGIETLLPKD